MEAKSYKCPSCGAGIFFDESSQKMKCKSCGNEYNVEDIDDIESSEKEGSEKYSWKSYDKDSGSGNWSEKEQEDVEVSTCPSCGAEIISEKNTSATYCVYCGNPTIIANRLSGIFRPDYVIPFKIDKDDAKEKLLKFCKNKILLPSDFVANHLIENLTGMYVPFWLFDCKTDSEVNYNAVRKTYWHDSEYNYEKTDHYLIIRAGKMDFENVPVDASTSIDEKFMEAVEPFDYSTAVDFKTAFLSGFFADKYDKTPEQSQGRANERIKSSIVNEFRNTVYGYNAVTPTKIDINIENGNISYALLPIWFFNAKYNDKHYKFAVNGQTGKIVGDLPVSKGKFVMWWLLFAIGLFSIALIILFLTGGGF